MLVIVFGMHSKWCSSTLCFLRRRGAHWRNWHSVSVLTLHPERRVHGLLISTVFEDDQELFRDDGVETLRERGESATYGTMEDRSRRTVRGEQG